MERLEQRWLLSGVDLTVDVSGVSSAYTNQPFAYTLTASNIGDIAASSIPVQFTLPSPNLVVKGTSASGFSESQAGNVVIFSGGAIAAHSLTTLTITVADPIAESIVTPVGAAVINQSHSVSESDYTNDSSTSTFSTAIVPAITPSTIDVAPITNQPFRGAVASFTDPLGLATGASATIDWGDGTSTSAGIIGADQNDSGLYFIGGSHTYTGLTGKYPVTVSVSDGNENTTVITSSAQVGEPPLAITPVAVNAAALTPLTNQTVATFTDPGVAGAGAPGSAAGYAGQFGASIDWGDGSSASAGTVTFNTATGVFSVLGSHTYATAGAYSVQATVTPLTITVSRVDSSKPGAATASPSAVFLDQLGASQADQVFPIGTVALPTVSTASGNRALTDASNSASAARLALSTNGQYLMVTGYNDTAASTSPPSATLSAAAVNRVIGTVDAAGHVDTTTALGDAYSGGNVAGAASADGQEFWTAGNANPANTGYLHYTSIGATNSTIVTGGTGQSNVNGVRIFNGQLYEALFAPGQGPVGIYQVGKGLPTTAAQPSNLFLALPQTNPLNTANLPAATGPDDFVLLDVASDPYSVNGVNVAYVADAQMGIARYDYGITGNETNPQWNFSYYIDSTGSFYNNSYTVVDNTGQIAATASFNPTNPAASLDPSKAGGITDLTARVVAGQVELFGITSANGANRVVEVTDPLAYSSNGEHDAYSVLATASQYSVYGGVALTPSTSTSATAYVISVTNPGHQYSANGDAVTLPIQANGLPPGDNWTFSASGLPANLSIDSGTGVISGTVAESDGPFNVTITANDGQVSASQTFTWTVSTLQIAQPGDQENVVGDHVSVQIDGSGLPAGDSWTYMASGLPDGLAIDPNTGIISGTVGATNDAFSATITASDGQGAVAYQYFNWTISLLQVANPGTQYAADQDIISLQVLSTGLPLSETLSYAATGLPQGLSISTGGLITGTVTDAAANYSVQVTATDNLGGSDTQSFLWDVSTLGITTPATQNSANGDSVSLPIAAAGLPPGDSWTFSASGLPGGLSIGTTSGVISGTANSTAGPYSVIITASDGNGASVSTNSFTWNVTTLSLTSPGTQSSAVGDAVSLPIVGAGLPTGDSWIYMASGLPSGLSIDRGTGLISGNVTGTATTYSPIITAADGQGASVPLSFTWNVSALSVANPGSVSSAVGDNISLPTLASGLPTGDSWTYTASGLPAGLNIDAGSGLISGTLAGSATNYFSTVTAADGQGASASASFTWGISALTLGNPGTQNSAVGDSVLLSLQSAGLPAHDAWSYSATGLPSGLSIDVRTGTISGIITAAGNYSAVVTASDGQGASTISGSFAWNVGTLSLTNPGTQNSAVGDGVLLQIAGTGLPAGASWSYQAGGLPSGLSINPTTGVITGTITGGANLYSVTVTASDGHNGQATTSFAWNVTTLTINNPGTQNNADGDSVSVQLIAAGLPAGDAWSYSATGLPATLSINSQSGLIIGTVTGAAKAYSVLVTASDGQGGSVVRNVTWNVSTLSVTSPGTQNNAIGDTVTLPSQSSGLPMGDSWSYSASGLPGGLSINPATGTVSGTVSGPASSYTVNINAGDGHGASYITPNFTWNVSSLTLSQPATQSNAVGDNVSLPMTSGGLPTGDSWSYSASGLPSGLSINVSTGLISGKITGSANLYAIIVSAGDGHGALVSQSFNWNVSAISLSNPGIQNSANGDNISLQLATAGLPAGDSWIYSATGLPAGLSVNSGTGLVSGTIQNAAASNSVTVTAGDGHGASVSQTFAWNLSTLSVTNPGTQNSAQGAVVSLPIIAGGLPTGDSWTYSATGLPKNLTINPATGLISGSVADIAQTYSVTATASDGHGASTSQTFSWNVSALTITNPGTQYNADGDQVSVQVVAGGFPANDPWSYSASGLPGNLSINPLSGLISGTVAGVAGTYSATVAASDGHGGTVSQSLSWIVTTLSASNPGNQANAVGDTVSLSMRGSGLPFGDSWSYTANSLPSGLGIGFTTGQITGTVGGGANAYPTVVSLGDHHGGLASAGFTWTVSVLAVASPGTQNSAVGDTVSLPLVATGLPAGDSWTFSASGLPNGLSINSNTGVISGVITGASTSYSPTITATDGHGASTTQSFPWNVSTLSVTNPGTQNNADGDSVSLPIVATGLPAGDTWTFSASGLPAGLSIDPASGLISGTITAAANSYPVTVTASDGQSNSVSQTFAWKVSPLTMTNPGTQNGAVGDWLSLPVAAGGLPVVDSWTYSAAGLPGGLSINSTSGTITGTIMSAPSTTPTQVTANDGHGASVSQSFTWNVSTLSIVTPATRYGAVGDTMDALQIVGGNLPTGDTWTYSASGLPSGLTVNPANGLIGGLITGGTENYAVTVSASDGHGAIASSQSFTWSVSMLSMINPGTQNSADQDAVSLQLQTAGLPSGDSWSYVAAGLPKSLAINPATGLIAGTVTDATGSFSALITASDGQGASVSQSFSWNVSTLSVVNPGNQYYTNGSAISLPTQVTGAPAGATLTYSAQNLPGGLSINSSTGLISGTISTSSNFNRASVTVSDNHGATSTATIAFVSVGVSIDSSTNSLYLVGGATADKVTVKTAGKSNTGSTGIQLQTTLNGSAQNATYSQSFTAIYFVGFDGNDTISFPSTLTIPASIDEGNGNNSIALGAGNATVVAGNGDDTITGGNGADLVTLGSGDDTVKLGSGNDTISASGGNNNIQVGNGNNVIVTGSGNDTLSAGSGDNLIVGGGGRDSIVAGNGNDILVDGSVSQSLAALEAVLNEWIADIAQHESASAIAADIRPTLTVNYNTANPNTLHAGSGFDWFWATYAKDNTNRKSTDLLN